MADDLKDQLKLSQALVMTPQLQQAIKMLATPSHERAALIASTRGVEPAQPGDPDPLQATSVDEQELQEETGVTPWSFLLERPAELGESNADVWIYNNPPVARSNRSVLPRLRAIAGADPETLREAVWLFRSLRQRAKTYERVVETLLELRPQLAIASSSEAFTPVPLRTVAEKVGMHESTITRVVSACRIQNLHGVWALVATKRGIGIKRTAS